MPSLRAVRRSAVLVALAAAIAAAGTAQEPVVQLHDLRSILAPLPGLTGRLEEPRLLLPVGPVLGDLAGMFASDGGRLAAVPVPVPWLGEQALIGRLEQLWSGEEGTASVLDQQLRLRAPHEVQATVRDVLALFTAIRQQSHRVILFELPAGAGAGQPAAVLEPQQVDALLQASAPQRATVSTVQLDVPWLWESGRSISYVRDFDVEVAEKATISDPKMGAFFAGQRLGLCLTSSIDGRVFARVALQSSASPAVPTQRKLEARGLGTLQLPEVEVTEASVTAALQPGGGILLSGDRERAVWLLRVEPAAQPPLQFGAAAALPLGGFAVPRLAAARNVDPSRRPEEDGSGQRGEFELHEPLAALEQALGDGFEDERGRVRMFGTHAVLIGQSPLRTRVEQLLRQQASQQRTVSVALKAGRVASELALRHVAGKAGADELAAALPGGAVVATLVEQPFAVTVGRELAFVRDYEVEIASKATAANPIVDSAFRGFQLRGTVHATAGALPQLTLRLLWADLAQLAAVDFTNSDLGAVDVPVSGWTDVEQRLTVRTGEWVPVHVAPDPQDPAAGSLVCLVRID